MFTTTHDVIFLINAAFFMVHYLTGALFFAAGRTKRFVEGPSIYLALALVSVAVLW